MQFNNKSLFLFNKKVGKRGISPLIATVLLVAFAVALGAVVMNWAKGVEETEGPKTTGAATDSSLQTSGCLVQAPAPADPLKQLMIKYLQGSVSKGDFFTQSQGYK